MPRHFVAKLDQFEDAKPQLFDIAGRSIGMIRVKQHVYAVRNVCPHKRAPVCRGQLRGTMLPSDPDKFIFGLDDQVLQCPWHGWEFDLSTGQTLCGQGNKKLTLYTVVVENDEIYVDL